MAGYYTGRDDDFRQSSWQSTAAHIALGDNAYSDGQLPPLPRPDPVVGHSFFTLEHLTHTRLTISPNPHRMTSLLPGRVPSEPHMRVSWSRLATR
jgi:hypothetical protein